MTTFVFSLLIVYLSWWMLSSQFRHFLYMEWTVKPFSTWEHIKGAVPHILKQLSIQNVQAQGFVDGELKLLNQRRSFMLLSFQRLAIIFPGLIFLGTLQIEIFISLIVLGTILLAIFFKKPVKWIQVAFLAGVFFAAYQWSYYQANQWVFSQDTSSLVYILADARIGTVLALLGISFLITLVTRYEYWSLWFVSILFFTGGLAYLNVFGLILGETLGWAFYWFVLSFGSSKKNKLIQREIFLITLLCSVIFFLFILWLKYWGFLDIRILSPVVSKKISLILGWAAWEVLVTFALSVWGHFRSKGPIGDTTDLESIKLPFNTIGKGLLNYRGWLPEQLQFRRYEVERRLASLKNVESQINDGLHTMVPDALVRKSQLEVESLKGLLGALPKNSV